MPEGFQQDISPQGFDKLRASIDAATESAKKLETEVGGLEQKVGSLGRKSGSVTLGGRSQGDVGRLSGGSPVSDYIRTGNPATPVDGFLGRGYEPTVAQAQDEQKARRTANNGPRDNTYTLARGANQNLWKAQHELDIANGTGDAGLIADAEAKMKRASLAASKQEKFLDGTGKSRDDLIMDAFMTSRIGPGGQLYPLINRLKAAGLTSAEGLQSELGMAPAMASTLAPMIAAGVAAAMPIALGAAGAAAGIGLAEGTSSLVRRQSSAYWGAGGTPQETAQMLALGGDANSAMALGNNLRSGSYGAAYMHNRGIYDIGSMTVDKAGNYIRATDELRKIKSDQQAVRIARDLGMSDSLWMRDLSDDSYNRLRESLEPLSASERRLEAEYRAQKAEFGNTADSLTRRIGAPFLSHMNDIMGGNGMSGFLSGMLKQFGIGGYIAGQGIDSASNLLGGAQKWLENASDAGANWLDKHSLNPFGNPFADENDKKKAESEQAAGNGQGLPYRQISANPEMIGGGPRAASSVQPGRIYNAMADQNESWAYKLGAFSIN